MSLTTPRHYERVKERELAADTVQLVYEHGTRVRYPPDSILQAIPDPQSTGSLNALKPSPTTRTRCNGSYRRNSAAAGSSFHRGISRRISPLCVTG